MQRDRSVPGSKQESTLGQRFANLTKRMDSVELLMVWSRATFVAPCSGIPFAVLVVVVACVANMEVWV